MVSKVVSFMIIILIVLCKGFSANNLTLKQVFIFSRHNLRYPLSGESSKYSSKPWPPLAGPPGHLTPRGARLEGYMGEYFSEWFKKEQFLPEGCPDDDTVYVYANKVNRTKATARAFIDAAFKNCSVPVHQNMTAKLDPIFQNVIVNTSLAFRDNVLEEIKRKLRNNSKVEAVYLELNKILEIEGSEFCKQDGICDLTKSNNTIRYEVGKPVLVNGPLSVASLVVDTFLMSYYNGMPIQDIAWGQITTPGKWNLLVELQNQKHDIKSTAVAKDVAAPLVAYLTKVFRNYDTMPKLMLLVGHDNNVNTLLTALGFQSIDLPNQFENFPIGGKLVFQRWADHESDYLKVEYVYPSWAQLRNGSKYSLESPPQRVVMRLKWCNTDEHGFCPWSEFVDKLLIEL